MRQLDWARSEVGGEGDSTRFWFWFQFRFWLQQVHRSKPGPLDLQVLLQQSVLGFH